MSLTIAIRKRARRGLPSVIQAYTGAIFPTGNLAVLKNQNEAQLGGVITPVGSVASATSGPSLVTVPKSISGLITPAGAPINSVVSGTPIDPVTELVGGGIAPTSVLVVGIDPATVTINKTLVGQIVPAGFLSKEVQDIIVPLHPTGNIAPTGALATLAGGPSIVTIPKSVSGTITPSSSISNDVTTPGIPITQSVDGTITPAGDLTGVIDPFTVTVLKSVSGTITPGSTLSYFSNKTVTKAVSGTITPAASVARVQGGPSFVTIPKSIGGTITPHSAIVNVVVPPPVTFFSKDVSGTITPSSTVARVVSGPSFITVPKALSATLAPAGGLSSSVSGPSFVTVPKAVLGMITPVGTLTKVVGGTSNVVVPKSLGSTITPIGSVTNLTSAPPVSGVGRAFGPFDLFNTFTGGPQANGFSGSCDYCNSSGFVSFVNNLVARDHKFVLKTTGESHSATDGLLKSNNMFDYSKWKLLMDNYNTPTHKSTAAAAVLSGNFLGQSLIDEPTHPSWGGVFTSSTPKNGNPAGGKALLDLMASYAKTIFPTVPCGMVLNHDSMASVPGPNFTVMDFTIDQTWYTYFPAGPEAFRDAGLAAAAAQGLAIAFSINLFAGRQTSGCVNSPGSTTLCLITSADLLNWGRVLGSAGVGLFMWKYDSTIWANSSLVSVMATLESEQELKPILSWRRGASQPSGNTLQTSTAVAIPAYPPPAIAVGSATRDAFTKHKVFHLLDNGDLQQAQHPATNSDNSYLFFVRGGAAMLGDLHWDYPTGSVQVANIRNAYDATFPGVLRNGIWDRNDRRYLYYLSGQAPVRIFRKDIAANQTVVLKDIGNDPLFIALWGSGGNALLGANLHSSRSQERFVGTVSSGAGAFAWDRLTGQTWAWKPPTGKTISRISIDDISQLVKTHFTDNTWQIVTLDVLGRFSLSAVLTSTDYPDREDLQTNKMWQSSGLGVKRWVMSPPDSNGTLVYTHPKLSSKDDIFSKGRVSLQAVDEVIYESMYYDGTLSTAWVQHSGEVYKINWATEQTSQPNKLAPQEVRQNITRLAQQTSLANLNARGEWFYDATAKVLYVRCTDGLSPSTKRMAVFDWRFGMEEVVMVNTNGTLKGRLCHHYAHSRAMSVDVEVSRGAAVSYDGSMVLFCSNWGGSPTLGIYAVLTDPNR